MRRVRVVAVACLVASSFLVATTDVSSAEAGPAPAPTVVDLPAGVRATPRGVDVVGETTSGDLVYTRRDLRADATGWDVTPLLRHANGDLVTLDSAVTDVVGDRLIRSVADSVPATVTSRLVGDASWSTLTAPAGSAYLCYTSDGMVLRTGDPGSEQIGLLPWDGTDLVPIAGIPSGTDVTPLARRVGHGARLMLWARATGTSAADPLLVDTTARRGWTVADRDPTCQPLGSDWSLSDDALVWQETTADSGRAVCITRLPRADEPIQPTVARPADALAQLPSSSRLLGVGDDVVVAPGYGSLAGWGTDPMLALRAIGPDGTVRTLAPAGYGVTAAGNGHVVAVTGSEPGRSAVVDLEVGTGSAMRLVDIDPVPSSYAGIAVDGDEVYYTDDSARLGAVRMRTVDFTTGQVGDAALIDADATGPVVAGGGGAAWDRSGWGTDDNLGHRGADGTVTTAHGGSVVGTDDRWVYDDGQRLTDARGDQSHSMLSDPSRFAHPAFQDGVTYAPGWAVPGAPAGSVVTTDAASRQAASIDVDGCATVSSALVAGSWMLVACRRADGTSARLVVDRTGSQAPWALQRPEEVRLGNGFLVARSSAGELSWTPLAGGAESWQPLGVADAPRPATRDYAVAVSSGALPTVAWFGGGHAHVALLPVATSPLPAHPTGVRPPAVPVVTVVGVDKALKVTWPEAAAAERITQYTVVARSSTMGARNASATVPGSWSGVFLPGLPDLTNGAPYTVTVTAWNLAGWSTAATVTGVPVAAPAIPTDVSVAPDPLTGRVDVSWTYAPTPGAEQVRTFTVSAGGATAVLAADARTASLNVSTAWVGDLTVSADGAAQSSTATVAVDLPGADVRPPAVRVTGLPEASLTGRPSFSVDATDDRRLAGSPVDIRWRTAALGHRLGMWARPAGWQGRPAGTVTVPPLGDGTTACFSVRAHDAAGNTSPWSAPTCTSTPVDDRGLTTVGTARRVQDAAWFRGTGSRLTDGRSQLRLDGPVAVTGWVLATTCPTCGSIRVVIGNTSYGTISLHSARRQDRRLLPIPAAGPQTGRVQVWLVGRRGPATIDGLVLQAH